MVNGLKFIHKSGGVHGNLKPTNVFYQKKEGYKLADCYGFKSKMSRLYDFVLSDNGVYSSPEKEYSEKSDVYSLGVICHELIYKCQPGCERKNNQVSYELKTLIDRMLEKDKQARLDCEQIMERLSLLCKGI